MLGEVASIQAGVGFPVELQGRPQGRYPFAKVGDISRLVRQGKSDLNKADNYIDESDLLKLRARLLPAGAIVFAKIGEAIRQNHRAITSVECLVDNNVMGVVARTELIIPRYLYHFLRTVNLYPLASSTTVPAIRKSTLEKIRVPLPNLSQQQRIVDVLDRADELRAKRRKALACLDDLNRSIFTEMFDDPETNNRGIKLSNLGSLVKLKSGAFLPGNRMAKNGRHAVLGGNGVTGHHDDYLFEEPKLVIGRVGAYCGCIHISPPKSWITDNALYASELDPSVTITYLAHALRRADLNKYASQSGQPLISASRVYPAPVLVPPIPLQRQFAERVDLVETFKSTNIASLAELDALFASSQDRAFRGLL